MPPYLLDFASAYLDDPPNFPEEVRKLADRKTGNIAFEPHDKK
jgi:hypothetical protein